MRNIPNRFIHPLMLLFVLTCFFAATPVSHVCAGDFRFAEPDPPAIELDIPEAPSAETTPPYMPPSALTEWTFHKTSDSLHPDGNEQQMTWMLNRARVNPTQEGVWLATMTDPDVASARSYFGVNLTVLQSAFAAIAAKPPAAFDVRLYNAAKAHSDYLIATNTQSHDGQITRVTDSGFKWSSWAGIVFSYSDHTVYGHAGFNIDWGNGPYGMQDPPGHRNAIMSVSGNYTNVGYAVVAESNPNTQVGPQVITGNLCYANTGYANHYNRFLVGTVWQDLNSNNQYDPGEGLSGVAVMPDKGTYFAVTSNGGGYAIPILANDTYSVTFSGGQLNGTHTRTTAVGSASVLLDLQYTPGSGTLSAQIGLFRPSIGMWFLDLNGNGQWNDCVMDDCINFGIEGDIPVTGDWNGDGATKIGVFRPSIGWWFLDYNGNGQWDGCTTDRCYNFGISEDTPVTGDWDGDGKTEIGVFRKSIGWWFLDYNRDGTWSGCSADRCYNLGISEDRPVTGDWNGDGKTEIGVFRPSIGWWFVDVNGNGTWNGCGTDGCYNFGIAEDLPVTGDWNGDGFTEIGVFRPSIGWWFLDYNGNDTWNDCTTDRCYQFGISVDTPVTGSF